jgi:hypothetical protein
MVSQRGVLNVFHLDPQRDAYARRAMPCGCTASMPSCSTASRWCVAPFVDSTMRASRSAAGFAAHAAARCGTTLSPGAASLRGFYAASTSSRMCGTGLHREWPVTGVETEKGFIGGRTS